LNNFMYWEAVRFGIRSGMKYLDLGRSPTGSSHYKSKEKWGAKPQQLTYLVYSGGAAEQGPARQGEPQLLYRTVEEGAELHYRQSRRRAD
jgi:hypothetical protein